MWKSTSEKETPGSQMKEFSSTTKIAPGAIGEYNEKDELYDPFEHRDKKHSNSDIGSLAHMVKSSLGSGILAMPNAIKNGGLLFGGIGTIFIGILCAHCVHILVRSSHALCRRTKTPQMSYSETAQAAFACGPKPIRPLANFMKVVVDTALCCTYFGGACVYVVFISTTMKQIAAHYTGRSDLDIRLFILALIPACILLAQIRNLKYLTPFSTLANVFMLVGLALTLYFVFNNFEPAKNIKHMAELHQIPKFFATVIFAIEGIGVVMPIENSMEKPQHFLGCPSVLNITMSIVVGLYTVMGVFGYLKYGEATGPIITLNLPVEDVLAQVVKVIIALAILFTYGLQYYVPLDITSAIVRTKLSHKYVVIGETIFRIFMALLTIGVALAVPDLEPFIALVGAVFFSILGLSIPAIVETISCWEGHLGTCYWRLIKNVCLVVFSIFGLLSGSWVAIEDIINFYTKSSTSAN